MHRHRGSKITHKKGRSIGLKGRESVLVTGAAGFIGSHVVDRLLKEGHCVYGLDNFDQFYGRSIKNQNLELARNSECFNLIEADLLDDRTYMCLPADIKAIIHLAGRPGVRGSLEEPDQYAEANYLTTIKLLKAAKKSKINRFIYASSSSVYGNHPDQPWHEEIKDLNPLSHYAVGKLASEKTGKIFSDIEGIKFTALRFFSVYGERQRPDLAIARFVRQLRASQPITIYGDGRMARDFTYVHDVVTRITDFLDYEKTNYEIVNIGSGHPVSVRHLVSLLEQQLGVKAKIKYINANPADATTTFASVAKCDRLLGRLSQTSFEQGLKAYLQWEEGRHLNAPSKTS